MTKTDYGVYAGVWETRGFACEIVAWGFLTHLSEKEAIDYVLHELPGPDRSVYGSSEYDGDDAESGLVHHHAPNGSASERSPLLRTQITASKRSGLGQFEGQHRRRPSDLEAQDPTLAFIGLNALEIAAIADAKKFLSQRVVQKIVDDIWYDSLSP